MMSKQGNIALMALLLAVSWLVLSPGSAQAHVLLADDSGNAGALLHITPDDDPIAGQPAQLFFTIQDDKRPPHSHSYSLQIVDSAGQASGLPAQIRGNTVSAGYVFPAQGAYQIILTGTPSQGAAGHDHIFRHGQRVARGNGGSPAVMRHSWAEPALIASLCGLISLLIIMYNRRQRITLHSKL